MLNNSTEAASSEHVCMCDCGNTRWVFDPGFDVEMFLGALGLIVAFFGPLFIITLID